MTSPRGSISLFYLHMHLNKLETGVEQFYILSYCCQGWPDLEDKLWPRSCGRSATLKTRGVKTKDWFWERAREGETSHVLNVTQTTEGENGCLLLEDYIRTSRFCCMLPRYFIHKKCLYASSLLLRWQWIIHFFSTGQAWNVYFHVKTLKVSVRD